MRIGCLKLPFATVEATEHIASGQETTVFWPTRVSARPAPDRFVGMVMYWVGWLRPMSHFWLRPKYFAAASGSRFGVIPGAL